MDENITLIQVIQGLYRIPVCGKEACGLMHDCIASLESLVREKQEKEKETAQDE